MEKKGKKEDDRPIITTPGDLLHTTAKAWNAVAQWTDPANPDQFLARLGDLPVRLTRRNGDGDVMAEPLDSKRMVNILAHSIQWMKQTKDGPEPCYPPPTVAGNMLADQHPPLPELERIISVPILAPDGSIHDTRGYDGSTKCFYEPARGLSIPAVKAKPTKKDVKAAGALLKELVTDFPFSGPDNGAVERAHAFDLLLTPFVRAMIEGATPLHLIEAPTPGSGKTLLAEVMAIPALGGRKLRSMVEGGNAEEWRKRLTAMLLQSTEYVLLDNLRARLDSSALASIITAGMSSDRLLGQSKIVDLKTRCGWIGTGNNPAMSDEMFRRTVRTRLDAQLEHPEERSGWTHPNLKHWTLHKRGDLVAAALTLGRGWVVAGQPDPVGLSTLGMFEDYSRVIGGILQWSELGNILGNREEFRTAVTHDNDGPLTFLSAVYVRYGRREFTTADVAALAHKHLGLEESDDNTAVGFQLRSLTDRPIGGLTLRQGNRAHGNVRKYFVESSDGGDGGDGGDPNESVLKRLRRSKQQ